MVLAAHGYFDKNYLENLWKSGDALGRCGKEKSWGS